MHGSLGGKRGIFPKLQRHKATGCHRKHRYEHFQEASAACRAVRAKGQNVEVYTCQFCGGWHVGH